MGATSADRGYSLLVSVKVPPKGSHGVRFPKMPSLIAKQFSRRQLQSFRKRHGGRTLGGLHTLMLETIGAKSGELRHAMLGYIEEAPGSWLIIASLGGAARHPAWLYNPREAPAGDGRVRRRAAGRGRGRDA